MNIHILLLIYIMLVGVGIYSVRGITLKRQNYMFVFLAMGAIFLVQALRAANVGWDTISYENTFYQVSNGIYTNSFKSMEPMFQLLNVVIAGFTDEPQYLLATCSLIIVGGISYFILGNCKTEAAFWPVFLFASMEQYFSTMNLLRQSCAMAIAINVFTVLQKAQDRKSWIKAIGLLILASLFHVSAWICVLLVIPFLIKKFDKKYLVLEGICCIAGVIMFSKLLQVFFLIFPQYEKYEDSFRFESNGISNYYAIMIVLKLLMIVGICTLSPRASSNKEIYRLAFVMVLSIGMGLMQSKISLAVRFGYYFDLFTIIFIPKVIQRMNAYKLLWYILLLIFGWTYFLYLIFITNEGTRGCVPYYFFWQ